ncbi:MAG: glucosaminidase domain-containing protein [Bacteroidales bacterium]|nr:glucosaminidase domain-containing protein [Bacteroidales bacterium]
MRNKFTVMMVAALGLMAAVLRADDAPRTPQEKYIAKYSSLAVSEMYRSGVPASITLAQGMIESGNGLSRLACEGNNHFGIKCHKTWKGKSMKEDDDRKNECFRVYETVEDSYRDHSDFLRYKDRYKPLFELETTDYKGWAHGLKKAGYATDPGYAGKLIKCIEDNNLDRFDRMSVENAVAVSAGEAEEPRPPVETVIPLSPLKMEEDRPYGEQPAERHRFSLSRTLLSRNGVPFLYAIEGETYESIAEANNLFPNEIRRFNDAPKGSFVHPGDVVYLQAKKNNTEKGLDKYIVDGDTSLRDICQRFAVREKSIRKLNGFNSSYTPQDGDEILLRKESVIRRIFRKK